MRPTGPGQAFHLLVDVIDILNNLRIGHMVIGAFAVSYHGLPRYTSDADALISLRDSGMTSKDLTDHLRAAGYNANLNLGDIEDPVAGAILGEDQYKNRIDLLLGIRGMDPGAYSRCLDASVLDSSVRIISAEDLIPMKIFAGGFRDLDDVRGILQVSGDRLNLELLRKLARPYGHPVAQKLEELLQEPPVPTE